MASVEDTLRLNQSTISRSLRPFKGTFPFLRVQMIKNKSDLRAFLLRPIGRAGRLPLEFRVRALCK